MSRHCSKYFTEMIAVTNLPIAISESISLTKNRYIRIKNYFIKLCQLCQCVHSHFFQILISIEIVKQTLKSLLNVATFYNTL